MFLPPQSLCELQSKNIPWMVEKSIILQMLKKNRVLPTLFIFTHLKKVNKGTLKFNHLNIITYLI